MRALEGRLVKAEDDRKALAAERVELRAAVGANARQAEAAAREAATAAQQLAAVLLENAATSRRLEEVNADLERLRAASLELRTGVDAGRAELKGAQEVLAKTQSELSAAQEEAKNLAESLTLANEQLAGKSIAPLVSAKDVAKLVNGFVSELGAQLPDLVIRDGEVRLRVAFGKVGRGSGFVVPSAQSPPEVRESLHELAIRFDRAIELPSQ